MYKTTDTDYLPIWQISARYRYRLSVNHYFYHTFIFVYFLTRQMLTYGRRIPLPELDKRIDVSLLFPWLYSLVFC